MSDHAASFGPATRAAKRTAGRRGAPLPRGYALPPGPDQPDPGAVVLAATQALLDADSRATVAAVLRTAVHDLGGGLVPARLVVRTQHVLEVDVSLGVGEPQLVLVEPVSVAAMALAQHLPGLVEDAQRAAARCDRPAAAPLPREREATHDRAPAQTEDHREH